MDNNTPDWLREADAPAPAAPSNNTMTTVPLPPPPVAPETADEVEPEELPGVILTMRLANMGLAVAIVVVSILTMVQLKVSSFVLAIYATFGGLLICCLETQLKFVRVMIALNFGFLFNSFWRFLFYLMMACVSWSFDSLLGTIVAIAFVVVACFNTYVLCRYPSYRKVREKIAEEEDKRIEARISKEVKRQAAQQLTK